MPEPIDPMILVYAARGVLAAAQTGSHGPQFVAGHILTHADQLPHAGRAVLVRDITAWLDGRGLDHTGEQRQPWVDALDALGGPRRAAFMNGDMPGIPTQRRRTDIARERTGATR